MSYSSNPLFYHTEVCYDELIEKREKAIRFKIDGIKVWMPIKCCKKLNEADNTVYIWTKVYESNMLKAKDFVNNLKETNQENLLN